jgi:hypothetical protein
MFCAELYRIGLKAELRRLICGGGRTPLHKFGQAYGTLRSSIETAERFWVGMAGSPVFSRCGLPRDPPVSRHDRTLLAHSLNRFLYLSTDELMRIAEDLTKIHIFK